MKFPEHFRAQHPLLPFQSKAGDPYGFFKIPGRHANGRGLKIVASDGGDVVGWEHVSVSLIDQPTKCPSWEEMCLVKDLFWEPEECIVQYHPAKQDYVNQHKGCLHLWRCTDRPMPAPPSILVGLQ